MSFNEVLASAGRDIVLKDISRLPGGWPMQDTFYTHFMIRLLIEEFGDSVTEERKKSGTFICFPVCSEFSGRTSLSFLFLEYVIAVLNQTPVLKGELETEESSRPSTEGHRQYHTSSFNVCSHRLLQAFSQHTSLSFLFLEYVIAVLNQTVLKGELETRKFLSSHQRTQLISYFKLLFLLSSLSSEVVVT